MFFGSRGRDKMFGLFRCRTNKRHKRVKGGRTTRRKKIKASGQVCFPGDAQIQKESGEFVPIRDIRVGDRVWAANRDGVQVTSTVIFVPHEPNEEKHKFVQLTFAGQRLRLTDLHYLPLWRMDPESGVWSRYIKRAMDVEVGDRLLLEGCQQDDLVRKVERDVEAQGVYSFVTDEEFLVVDGVVVSPYGYDLFSHDVYHQIFNVLRWSYRIAPVLNRQPWVAKSIMRVEQFLKETV